MEIILKQDVQNLGYADDLVKVKDGYARNYLIPNGLAELATPVKKKMLEETLKQRAYKAEKLRQAAEFMAGQISNLEVTIPVKASEKGTLFGSVTADDIVAALKDQHNVEINRRKIVLNQAHIKELGEHTVIVNLHKDFNKVELKLKVVAEEDKKVEQTENADKAE